MTLRSWLRARSTPARLAQRARILLLAAEGVPNSKIARQVLVSRPTVLLWRRRYVEAGLDGLADRPKPGRPATVDVPGIVAATLMPPPARLGVTHWSSRLLAAELGLHPVTVSRTWKLFGLQPWRTESFKFSTDPVLEAKARDIVGLYLNPPVPKLSFPPRRLPCVGRQRPSRRRPARPGRQPDAGPAGSWLP